MSPGENLATAHGDLHHALHADRQPGDLRRTRRPGALPILDGITVRAPNGATLRVPGGTFSAVAIWPLGAGCPSGATLDGFTLVGGAWGAYVGGIRAVHQAVQ